MIRTNFLSLRGSQPLILLNGTHRPLHSLMLKYALVCRLKLTWLFKKKNYVPLYVSLNEKLFLSEHQ